MLLMCLFDVAKLNPPSKSIEEVAIFQTDARVGLRPFLNPVSEDRGRETEEERLAVERVS